MGLETREYQICNRCVMDTTDPDIIFDENGICNYCRKAESLLNLPPYSLSLKEKEIELFKIVKKIKEKGKGKDYDCVIGVSGGVDSSFTAYKVVELGLRPLAVHLDNGWDSELAVKNIENIVNKLGIDLYTHVIDWEEFKDLQLSFLKASLPDSEIPTDHAIVATMYTVARNNNIKYILSGTNLSTESIFPPAWSYGSYDWKQIKSIQETFGEKKLLTFPHISLVDIFIDRYIRNIKRISILNYLDYIKKDAIKLIKKELDWRYYGLKHYESIYSRFSQGYILPVKFGFDKRKSHLSSLIISNQITREEALNDLKKDPYPSKELLEEDKEFILNKFEIDFDKFEEIMKASPKKFLDYPSYEKSIFWGVSLKAYIHLKNRYQ